MALILVSTQMGKCTIYINRCGQSAVDFTLVWVAVMLDCSAQNILNIVMAWQCSLRGYKACCDSWSYSSWILYFGWGGGERWLLGLSWERTLLCMHPNGFTLGVYFWSDGKSKLHCIWWFCCSQWHTHTLPPQINSLSKCVWCNFYTIAFLKQSTAQT